MLVTGGNMPEISGTPALLLEKQTYSVKEVCELLSCSRGLLNRLIREGKLKAFRLGDSRKRSIHADEIERFYNDGYTVKKPAGTYCAHVLDNGDQCLRRPVKYSDYCWSHSEE